MSKITIYEVQERMQLMETLVELLTVGATSFSSLKPMQPTNIHSYKRINEKPQEQVRSSHLIAAI